MCLLGTLRRTGMSSNTDVLQYTTQHNGQFNLRSLCSLSRSFRSPYVVPLLCYSEGVCAEEVDGTGEYY